MRWTPISSWGSDATKEDLLRAIDGHIITGGELTGEQVGEIIRF